MGDIMNWIKNLWNKIISSNDDQYIEQISQLKNLRKLDISKIEELNKELSSKTEQNNILINENNEKTAILNDNLLEISNLENLLEQYIDKPDVETYDIDVKSNDYPYLPKWKVYYWNNDKVTTKDIDFTPTKFYKIWSDEMYKFFNNAIKDCKTFDEKVVKLRDIIRKRVVYKRDVSSKGNPSENWRLPPETFYGQIGDCEDNTILWIAACKMCGLPADRVFNATGYVKWLGKEAGHSWGVAKFDDGNWYVVDSTSNRVVKFLGSDYSIKGFIRGISNWKFSGVPKNEQF
jgi:hypothetical protein